MRFRRAGWSILGLALLMIGGGPRGRSQAQVYGGGTAYGNLGFRAQPIPRQGTWAEVVTVAPNGRWLVLQNGEGQQFPVASDSIDSFLMRWPTSLDRLTPSAMVDALGVDLGTNTTRTDHVDVYDGAEARTLVTPMAVHMVGNGRVLTGYDIDRMNTYGDRYFLPPDEANLPMTLRIIGPVVGTNPLQLGAANNIVVTVLPSPAGMTMSQVTRGSFGLVQPGDLVYYVVDDIGPKSLALSQLVVYKKVPVPR